MKVRFCLGMLFWMRVIVVVGLWLFGVGLSYYLSRFLVSGATSVSVVFIVMFCY